MKKLKHNKRDWPIVAGIFIGLGVGFVIGKVWGYLLIGFGLGL